MSAKVVPTDMPAGERFFHALRDLHDGELLRQLDEGITALTAAVLETGGKGQVVLKIAVSKLGKDRQVAVKPSVTRVIPQEEVRQRLVWADAHGRFCENDPAQGEFEFDAPKRVQVEA